MAFVLPQLLTEATERDPQHEAVRCGGRSLTYDEVDSDANALARALIDAGVRRGDRVGIYLPKTAELLPAVYGTMRAGAAYVPLDPRGPVERAAVIAGDCSISALVTTPDLASALASATEPPDPKIAVLIGEGDFPPVPFPCLGYAAATSGGDKSHPGIPLTEIDLAYILYTSGSTGPPKGVMLSHRNALAFVEWCASAFGVGPGDRLSNHAPLHFDLSVFDLYLAAHGGATVVLVPEEEAFLGASLSRFIKEESITVWYSVPTALRMLVRATPEPGEYPTLRAVAFAGEVYPTPLLRELQRVLPEPDLWNLYGPTETNVCAGYRVVHLPEDDRTIPIGRACENTEIFALTDSGELAEVGEPGELFVRGATVMKGYWGLPDKTAEVLVPNPLQRNLPDPVYRTGDLVRLRADGDYDFLGRRDHQIKSRGYRIELGEVEAALASHPALDEVVTVAIPHQEWGTAIVAQVVAKNHLDVTPLDVKRHAATLIPRYMVPARIDIVTSLPRTANGKIDRRRILDEIADSSET
jgi:amino acid adenylation domain-containing protein